MCACEGLSHILKAIALRSLTRVSDLGNSHPPGPFNDSVWLCREKAQAKIRQETQGDICQRA